MVRIGDDLHVVYRVRNSRSDPEFVDDSAASGIAGNFDMGVYIRTFDLDSKTFRPAVRVLRRAIYHRPTGSRLSAFSVHHEPSVFRDGAGRLRPMAFADAELRRDRFAGTPTFPPLQTSISDLDDPRSCFG
jgi:hypothetical protein